MKLIPLTDINDQDEFWMGTRFRIYNVGLNVSNKDDDYYEYMLAEIPGDSNYMLMTNVVGHKSGSALALVKTTLDQNRYIVTGKSIKFSIGTEKTYLLKDYQG